MVKGKKRKKFVSLLLVLSLAVLSVNIAAREKKGAKLKVEKDDGQEVTGELISVEKDSLLLLTSDINADISERVLMKEVKSITIVKKSRGFQVSIYGVLAGVLYGSINRPAYRYEDKSQSFWMSGVIGGVAGFALGMVIGINKTIQIQGKSETEIQDITEKLNQKARVPNLK